MVELPLSALRSRVDSLYASTEASDLAFHGWLHVDFVRAKALHFARYFGARKDLVEAAALLHDVNYLVDVSSDAARGGLLRRQLLAETGFPGEVVERIETIILEAETASRGADISPEGMALSDADTLFKCLPITPVLLAPMFMQETQTDLASLARKIVNDQLPLQEEGIYFYSDQNRRAYGVWAATNLELWKFVLAALEEPEIAALSNASAEALESHWRRRTE